MKRLLAELWPTLLVFVAEILAGVLLALFFR
jgi:hypothetical protein